MDQIIRELSSEMIKTLESQRDWVRNHYTLDSIDKYNTVEGKLYLLDTIIKSKWINKDETFKLQCLGITLGDALVQDLGLKWIEIEDNFGIDPAIQLENTSIILFPLTMISKRIESDEEVEIIELFKSIENKVYELKNNQ